MAPNTTKEDFSEVYFANRWYKGKNLLGSCDEWEGFRFAGLRIPSGGAQFTSIRIWLGYEDFSTENLESVHSTCNDLDKVSQLVYALSFKKNLELECDGYTWRVFACGSHAAFCLNCDNGCTNLMGSALLTSPCKTGLKQASAFNFFKLTTAPRASTLISLSSSLSGAITVSDDGALVSLGLSQTGVMYCAAFKTTHDEIIDRAAVKALGFYSATDFSGSNIATVTVRGLTPRTAYNMYCQPETMSGKGPSDLDMVSSKVSFTTTGTPQLQVRTSRPYAMLDGSATTTSVVFTVSLPSQPSVNLDVNLYLDECYSGESVPSRVPALDHSIVSFARTATELSANIRISNVAEGCIRLVANTTSTGVHSYRASGAEFNVFSYESYTPSLVSAKLSNNGEQMEVHFDGATDRAGQDSSAFNCSLCIAFPGVGGAVCRWQTPSALYVVLGSAGGFVDSGDSVRVVPNSIRQECQTPCDASNHNFSSASTAVTIIAPNQPMAPMVSLSSSTRVGACDDVILDPTNSYGSAGRPWTTVRWYVESTTSVNSQNKAALIETFLNSNFADTSSSATIPRSQFVAGKYTFSLELQNRFLLSSQGVQEVDVSDDAAVPQVRIVGPASININRWQPLSVTAEASFPSCASTGAGSRLLTYSWKVYRDVQFVFGVTSLSKDPRVFSIPPYVFEGKSRYTIEVSVEASRISVMGLEPLATANVAVDVGVSNPHVEIVGAAQRLQVGASALTLDASLSYDRDYPSTEMLTYKWKCEPADPSSGTENPGDCSTLSFSSSTSVTTTIGANTVAPGDYLITVTGTNGRGRVSHASVRVVYISYTRPLPTIGSLSPLRSKYNADDRITVNLTMTVPFIASWVNNSVDILSMPVVWGCKELAVTALTAAVSRPVRVDVPGFVVRNIEASPPSAEDQPVNIPLVYTTIHPLSISAGSLAPGADYTFYLAYDSVQMLSFTVITNSPPVGGRLVVAPSVGEAMVTLFHFTAKSWIDDPDDYPLSYAMYSYTSNPKEKTVIKRKDPSAYINAYLKIGIPSINYLVTCIVQVYDIYNSATTASSTATVTFSQTIPQLSASLTTKLATAEEETNSELVIQLVSAATSVVSLARCVDRFGAAITDSQCHGIGREPCTSNNGMCGGCLPGFVGTPGHSIESPCIVDNSGSSSVGGGSSRRVLSVAVGDGLADSTCAANSDCFSGICTSNKCTQGYKSCPGDCNGAGAGYCEYYSRFGMDTTPCSLEDVYCFPRCKCLVGKYGPSCDLTREQYYAGVEVRDAVCSGLWTTLRRLDVTPVVITSISTTVMQTLEHLSEVTDAAYVSCSSVLLKAVTDNPSAAADDEAIGAVVIAISAILSRGYPLPSNLLSSVFKAITAITVAREELMSLDEPSTAFATPYMRMWVAHWSSEKLSASANTSTSGSSNITGSSDLLFGSANLAVPLMPLEALMGMNVAQVKVGIPPEYGGVGVALSLLNFNEDGVYSNSSKVRVEFHPFNDDNDVVPITSLSAELDYWDIEIYNRKDMVEHSMQCEIQDIPYEVSSLQIGECDDNEVFNTTCTGTKLTTFEFTCSGYERLPVCMQRDFSITTPTYDAAVACRVDTYDATKALCICEPDQSQSLGVNSNFGGRMHKTVELAVSSFVFDLQKDPLVTRNEAYQPLPPVKNYLQILCVLGFILLSIVIGFSFGEIDWDYFENLYVPGKYEAKMALKEGANLKHGKKHDNYIIPEKPVPTVVGKEGLPARRAKVKYPAHHGLPDEMLMERWPERLKRVLIRYHMYGSMISGRRGDDYDLLLGTRWIQVFSRLMYILLGTTVAGWVYFADDGVCETLREKDLCLEPTDVTGMDHMCLWYDRLEYCVFKAPALSPMAIVMVAGFGAVFNAPLSSFTEYAIRKMDEYLRVFLRYRVVEYDKEKKASTAWANKVIEDWEESIREEARKIQEEARLAAYKKGEEWIPSDASSQATSQPGGTNGDEEGKDGALVLDDVSKAPSLAASLTGSVTSAVSHNSNHSSITVRSHRGEKNDPLDGMAALKYTWSIAAKLVKMQQEIDYVSSIAEAKSMDDLNGPQAIVPVQGILPTLFLRYHVLGMLERMFVQIIITANNQGNPISAAQILHCESENLVLAKVRNARQNSNQLLEWMSYLRKDERNAFLMNMFLVYSLEGARHRVALRLALKCAPTMIPDSILGSTERFYYLGLTPGILAPIAIIILVINSNLGPGSLNLWGIGYACAVLLDVFLFHPFALWLKHIAIPAFARNDMVKMYGFLMYRARFIMTRVRGNMVNRHALVQHFNPACRAARMMPEVPSARLLLGLHDWDMGWPGANHLNHYKYKTFNRSMYVKRSRAPKPHSFFSIFLSYIAYLLNPKTWGNFCVAVWEMIIFMYSCVPEMGQDLIVEVVSVVICGFAFIYIAASEDKLQSLIIVLVGIGLMLLIDNLMGDGSSQSLRNLKVHTYIKSKKPTEPGLYDVQRNRTPAFAKHAKIVPDAVDDENKEDDEMTELSEEFFGDDDYGDDDENRGLTAEQIHTQALRARGGRRAPAPIRSVIPSKTYQTKSQVIKVQSTKNGGLDPAPGGSGSGAGTVVPPLAGMGPFRSQDSKPQRQLGQLIEGEVSYFSALTENNPAIGVDSSVLGPSGSKAISGTSLKKHTHYEKDEIERQRREIVHDNAFHPMVGEEGWSLADAQDSAIKADKDSSIRRSVVLRNAARQAVDPNFANEPGVDRSSKQWGIGPGVTNLIAGEETEWDQVQHRLKHLNVASADDHSEIMFTQGQGGNELTRDSRDRPEHWQSRRGGGDQFDPEQPPVNAFATQHARTPSSPHYPRRSSPPRPSRGAQQQTIQVQLQVQPMELQQQGNPNQPYRSPMRRPTGGPSTGKYPMVVD